MAVLASQASPPSPKPSTSRVGAVRTAEYGLPRLLATFITGRLRPGVFVDAHCVLEMTTGPLSMLPMMNNPVERKWFVVSVASRQVPQVTLALDEFLRHKGQVEIEHQRWQPWRGLVQAAHPREGRRQHLTTGRAKLGPIEIRI